MDDMESKLGAILGNPDMMAKIMAMAQAFGQNAPNTESAPQQDAPAFSMPDVDFTTIQKLAGLASNSRISKEQQALLHALSPYLSRHRIAKLERAMQAAKMAGIATSLLGKG